MLVQPENRYALFLHKDSLSTRMYFIYEITPVQFLKIFFGDSIKVDTGYKEVKQIRKYASGIIISSLWNSMKKLKCCNGQNKQIY